MSDPNSAPPLPGNGFFGWLGRQFGYVSKAVRHDPAGPKTVYRASSVEEKPLPQDPNVKLRRTTIDEVIMNQGKAEGRRQKAE
jgi:TPP-dependent pyruvate/acetoin dehydrogenase alpha subunit